jgi:putative FmdB family regulatory protein
LPIYGYRCDACGAEIEKRQGFHDAPLTTCEQCGGALRRILHPVGIVFKGSGFYNTDNRKTAAPTATGSGSEPSKSSGESSNSNSESSSKSSDPDSSSSKTNTESAPAKSSTSESSSSPKPANS